MLHPRRHALAALATLLACACFPAAPARAAWPSDPTVNVPLCTASNTQQTPECCSDGAGGAIVAWFDNRAGNTDIYAQRVNRDGVAMWAEDGVAVCTASGGQSWVAICADGAGGAIIAWQDYRAGHYDIYVQRVNSSGTPQWTANGVALCTSAEGQQGVQLCTDGSGGAIAVWRDYRNASDNNIYARRVNSSGTPQWTANGVALCTATSEQSNAVIVSDGTGGAIVAWHDYRNGLDYNIYAQRVNSSGTVQWTANGVVVCDAATSQFGPCIASDGLAGAIVAWTDSRSGSGDVYAQRLSVSGTSQWTADGVVVCAASDDQSSPQLVSDGAGGVIATWMDYRNGADHNIYAQRLRGDGHPLWTANGVSLCTASGEQLSPHPTSDGAGGAIVAWTDYRTGGAYLYARRVSAAGAAQWASNGVAVCTIGESDTGLGLAADDVGGAIVAFAGTHGVINYNVYAQRVDRFGALGEAEPDITAVADVAADQGGQVVVRWTPSYLDAEPTFDIIEYSLWREVPASLAASRPMTAAAVAAGRPALRSTVLGTQTHYWEYVGSVPARAREAYSLVAPTTTDSMGGGNPLTRFMVSAEEYGGTPYWDSAPDSGYSVDDLAPPAPAPFTGAFSGSAAYLQWGASPAGDFAAFRLYRGVSADFVPGPGNLVTTTTAGGFTDPAPALHYKLCAVDVHGNAGPYASLHLADAVDVPSAGVPREVFLAAPSPNPARAGAMLRFGLPRPAHVTLAVHDAQGRCVRTLHAGPLPAGEHGAAWDGTDAAGRALPAGLYLCRLETGGRALARRLAVVR